MRFNLKLSHKGLILVCVPLTFELLFVGTLYWLLRQAVHDADREARAKKIALHGTVLSRLPIDAFVALNSYRLTGKPQFVERYEETMKRFSTEFKILYELGRDDPRQEESIRKLEALMQRCLKTFEQSRIAWEENRKTDSIRILSELKPLMYDFQLGLDQACAEAARIQEAAPEMEAQRRHVIEQCLAAGIVLNVSLAFALAIYFNRGTTQRLTILMENTGRLARRQALNPPVPGGDEIAHLDHTFHEMADALAQSERARRELMAMVSHDLRSPLTSIQGSLILLGDGVFGTLSEKALIHVKSAERNAIRLIDLINTLLDLDKMESGRLELHLEDFPLSTILERSLEAVHTLAEQANIVIELPAGDTKIRADSERLVQVVVNLLSNAIKFSPQGSVITISINQTADYVEVTVTDRGRGIPDAYKTSIFERFQQVCDSDAREKGGSGLGLAICTAIIDSHGGSIGVESEEGKGSTFWFRLPQHKQK